MANRIGHDIWWVWLTACDRPWLHSLLVALQKVLSVEGVNYGCGSCWNDDNRRPRSEIFSNSSNNGLLYAHMH